jgi:sialic acid synthase SpsE
LWGLHKSAQTLYNWHKELFDYAKDLKITCFSLAFDETSVDRLESLSCPFYKVISFEINHNPLIKKIGGIMQFNQQTQD